MLLHPVGLELLVAGQHRTAARTLVLLAQSLNFLMSFQMFLRDETNAAYVTLELEQALLPMVQQMGLQLPVGRSQLACLLKAGEKLKGAVSRDFLAFFYFMNRSHLGP